MTRIKTKHSTVCIMLGISIASSLRCWYLTGASTALFVCLIVSISLCLLANRRTFPSSGAILTFREGLTSSLVLLAFVLVIVFSWSPGLLGGNVLLAVQDLETKRTVHKIVSSSTDFEQVSVKFLRHKELNLVIQGDFQTKQQALRFRDLLLSECKFLSSPLCLQWVIRVANETVIGRDDEVFDVRNPKDDGVTAVWRSTIFRTQHSTWGEVSQAEELSNNV